MESNRFQINKEDMKKVGIGALVAVAVALLAYFSEAISQTNFGPYTPIVVAAFSVLANIVRKWIAGSPQP